MVFQHMNKFNIIMQYPKQSLNHTLLNTQFIYPAPIPSSQRLCKRYSSHAKINLSMVNELSNKIMIQLQNYINSSTNLQSRHFSKMRRNFVFFPARKFMRSVNHSRNRHQTSDHNKDQSDVINQARGKYQQLIKMTRESIKLQFKTPRYSFQKGKVEVANFVKFKGRWKPRLGSELNKSLSEGQISERSKISKTMVPKKVTQTNQNQSARKQSIKTEAQLQKCGNECGKPMTAILKRILNEKLIKDVREVIRTRNQYDKQTLLMNSPYALSLKHSHLALERLKKQDGFKPIKRNKRKLDNILKKASLQTNTGQKIAGWTIKQFAD